MKKLKISFSSILWIISYIACTLGLFFYTREIFDKWQYNPDIMTTNRLISSYEIPMPAITICSPLLARRSKIDFQPIYGNPASYKGDESDKCYPVLAELCSPNWEEGNHRDAFKWELAKECLPSINDTFKSCRVKEIPYSCENEAIQTPTGYINCFTFNSLKTRVINDGIVYNPKNVKQDWTLSDGYAHSRIYHPVRAVRSNRFLFELTLDHEDFTNICFAQWKSYRVLFHRPNEIFSIISRLESSLEFDQTKVIELTAKRITTDESLRFYTPKQRRCYFEGEKLSQLWAHNLLNLLSPVNKFPEVEPSAHLH